MEFFNKPITRADLIGDALVVVGVYLVCRSIKDLIVDHLESKRFNQKRA